MAETKNLCAQIPLDLHAKVCEAKERLGITTSQYMTGLLRTYFTIFCTQEKKGVTNMENSRTMAFQIPEELFQRIKRHLEHESARLGRKVTQREFVLGLMEAFLEESEGAGPVPAESPEMALGYPRDRNVRRLRAQRSHRSQMSRQNN